jgi:ParB family chromosome partitioning protein
MELALVENLQRENLSPLETAAAYQALMDGFGLTREQLAHRLGKSRAAVTNTLRLTNLPERILALLGEEKLSEGHARALLSLQTEEQMLQVAQKVVAERLSVRKTEELVRERLSNLDAISKTGPREESATPRHYDEACRLIRDALELPVRVKSSRQGGKIEIRFQESQQLEALVTLLTSQKPTR